MSIKSLSTKRAEKEGNQAWTVRDCLQEIIRQIDAKEIAPEKCVLILSTQVDNNTQGCYDVETWYANTSMSETIAALSAAVQRETERFRGR